MNDLVYLTASEAASLIRRKILSPVEYVRTLVDRIAGLDDRVNAFLLFTPEEALADARRAEKMVMTQASVGSLHGVPFAVKDLIDVEGLPTTAHSAMLRENIAKADATVVAQMRSAGAISLGKLAMEEFGVGAPMDQLPWPPARNPWQLAHTPGGSSSGAGAALAAGFIPIALGTDSGGSVRCPAAMCGVVGMKPSYGRISRTGVFPLSQSLDHVGLMSRTVEDNALAFDALARFDPADPSSSAAAAPNCLENLRGGIRDIKIGVARHFYVRDCPASEETANAVESAVALLAELGATVCEVELRPLQAYKDCGSRILQAEGYAVHKQWLTERASDYGDTCRKVLLDGAQVSQNDHRDALRIREMMREELDAVMREFHVLVTTVSPVPACPLDDAGALLRLGDTSMRIPFNITGNPAMAIPVGFTEGGLPLSMQIVGRNNHEAIVYRVGHEYQQATSWHRQHPSVPNMETVRDR